MEVEYLSYVLTSEILEPDGGVVIENVMTAIKALTKELNN
ncbi:Protein of unknown function [Bacillus cytotoxicus]|nr:Protein of unknown function [Bacillus cytotoxicus]